MVKENGIISDHSSIQNTGESTGFSRSYQILYKRRWIVFLMGMIGLIIGVFYAQKKPVVYESHLTFSLDEGAGGSGTAAGGLLGLVAQFGLAGGGGNDMFSGDNILEVIKSRRIVEAVLLGTDTVNNKQISLMSEWKNMKLKHIKSAKQRELLLAIQFPAGSKKNQLTYIQDSLLYKAYEYIVKYDLDASRPDKKLNIYQIKFRSENERFTKIFTDRILSVTTQFYTELKTKKSMETLNVLEERVAAVKNNLGSSIVSRAASQDANINPAFAKSQVPIQKQQINIQAYGVAYGELCKNLELARFQYLQNVPLLQIIDNADYPMDEIKSSKLKYMSLAFLLFSFAGGLSILLFAQFKKKRSQ